MEVFRLVFSPIPVNTYILAEETGECAIIDCGCYDSGEFKILTDFLTKKNLKPVMLLNTHCHLDHIFGNNFMLASYKLRAYSHILEEYNRKNSVNHSAIFGLEMEYPPEQEGFIEDMQKISFGNTTLTALHVPGHSPGGLAFYSEKDRCVFTGDTLFAGTIGRTDLPGGNHESIMQSIKTQLFTLPGSTIVYPGHGEKTDIKTEMTYNPYFS
ncbi:MAG TPA: MBL fold metallo-hydrolase [Bacteroidales bacterium]|nr:MBL fold metallo-hydrolase [Bacteroidales bacterium]